MAAESVAVLKDGKIELPAETLESRHWTDGLRLEIVPVDEGVLIREVPRAASLPEHFTFDQVLALNRKQLGLPADAPDWQALGGILSDDFVDSLQEKHRLRDEELAHDRDKFGT